MYEESASIPALSDCLLPQPHYSGADLDGKIVKVVFCVFLQLRNSARNSLTDANNNTTGFTYDGFDRLSVTTYPDATTETYAYDANSRVVARKPRGNNTASFAAATIPSIATPASTLTYTASTAYDALNRPTGITFGDVPAAAVPGTPVNVAFTHSYNAVNQRTGQSVTDNAWIEYPSVASTTAYTANALNQYTSVGGVTPTYDANGNLLTDGTNTYTYAAENRLVSATKSGSSATYTYDGRGRRTSKTVNGATTVYVTGADSRELLEYDGATGAIQRWYAYGLGPNDVVAQMNVPAGTRATPIPDIQGSIVGALSNAGVLTVFAYRPFGSSAAPPATFGYTGQRYDAETGSYYYRARQYSAGLGRFFQPDPIGYGDGTHLYAYVGNDPLNLIDPSGLSPQDWWDIRYTYSNLQRAIQLSDQYRIEASILSTQAANGNESLAFSFARNGVFDAWRHASWSRQTALETNQFTAWIAGTGHEIWQAGAKAFYQIQNLATGNTDRESWRQHFAEIVMDMNNNRVGREAAASGSGPFNVTRHAGPNDSWTYSLNDQRLIVLGSSSVAPIGAYDQSRYDRQSRSYGGYGDARGGK